MGRYTATACVYCGRVRKLTRDHVPPRALFPPPRPGNLITVPACSPCNDSFKKDDEYFLLFALTQATLDPAWEEFARGKFAKRGPGLRRELRASIRQVDLTTPAGLHVARVEALAYKRPRVNRVLERIVRGLTWHYYQARLLDDVTFTIRTHTELGANLPKIVDIAREGTFVDARGGSVFQYRGGRAVEDTDQALWMFSFY